MNFRRDYDDGGAPPSCIPADDLGRDPAQIVTKHADDPSQNPEPAGVVWAARQ
ncbi:hypothetical protein [Pseudarthrobacter quantipunctorum]|uniref:Uncharacterized protein n=1 Tax=Pseudarthrobacter quantipunctorum TaxID=3128980 RepID=A0ABZ2R761_9MICC